MARAAKGTKLYHLAREADALRAAISLLHRVSGLVLTALEVDPTCAAVLTGVTAAAGLGMGRAMLFLLGGDGRLHGVGAVGALTAAEAATARRARGPREVDLDILAEKGTRRLVAWCPLAEQVRATAIDVGTDTPVALALRRGKVVAGRGRDDAGGLFHLPTSVAAPLRDRHAVSGVLYADSRFGGARLDEIARMVFCMVAEDAGRALEHAQRYEQVASEARTDALTGLDHHGAFTLDLERAVAAACASGCPLGLAMIDLDGFKHVNDGLGHLAGDALLAGLAARMRGVMRGGAGLYRFGGDEFAAILPGADRAAAAIVGERLHRAVIAEPFALGEGVKRAVACSIGVASMPEDASSAHDLIARADEALLRAKACGKDRVEAARPGVRGSGS